MIKKFRIKYRDSNITIRKKLDWDESINQREVDILNSKIIRGIMKPTILGPRKISYLSPEGANLSTYLHSGISKNDFFLVIAQILEVTKSIDRNALNINNLVLNLKYVFVNSKTKAVNFIYQPIDSQKVSSNLLSFLYDVAYHTTLGLDEDVRCINELITFMRGLKSFSSIEIEKYILRTYPEVYKQVKRQKPGQSEMLNGKDVYYRRNEWEEKKHERQQEEIIELSNKNKDEDDEDTSLLIEDDEYGDDTALLDEDYNDDTSLLDEDDENTSLLIENDEDDENTSLLVEDEDDENTTLLMEDDENTTLLEEDEQTSLLDENIKTFPYLIRLSTYDRVDINKPSFRIGKEKSYVDYFVLNNNAVSRIHADIITRDGQFYIKDNNSTNRTFVNGLPIPTNVEVEIFDGNEIMLANERFEFHTE